MKKDNLGDVNQQNNQTNMNSDGNINSNNGECCSATRCTAYHYATCEQRERQSL